MFAGGWPGFWTVNGAYFMPRKPGPTRWAVPPTPMNAGQRHAPSPPVLAGHDRRSRCAGNCDERAGRPAGVHQGRAALVVAFVGHQRADDRQVLELLGDVSGRFSVISTPLAAVLIGLNSPPFGLAGLHVPQVDVARAAAHPQDDEALVLLLQLVAPRPAGSAGSSGAGRARAEAPGDVRQEVPAVHHRTTLPSSGCASAGGIFLLVSPAARFVSRGGLPWFRPL